MTPTGATPELTVLTRIPSGSNAVFRCVDAAGDHWVYKPVAGERPLHDFPDGTLAGREVAAYLVSEALGWGLVPETVTAHGPGGPGMAQRWVDEDPAGIGPVGVHGADAVPDGLLVVLRGEDGDGREVVVAHSADATLRRIAVFDQVVNNADRKGGHLLVDTSGRVWAIDHGLAFHVQPKVRTVLWGWSGTPLHPDDLPGLTSLADALGERGGRATPLAAGLAEVLSPGEVDAVRDRVRRLLSAGRHPLPETGYPLPWPLF